MEAREGRSQVDTTGAAACRVRPEDQLLISRLRLESIIESAMDAIITVDEDQAVVLFNHAAEQMFGCTTQEAIGQSLDRFLPAHFRDAHRHHIHTFGQSGVTSRKMGKLGTVMGLRANGEEFPIEAAISHITVDEKKYYTVILRDITERRRAEAALEEGEARLQGILNSMEEVVWSSSLDLSHMLYVSPAIQKIYGRPPADFMARPPLRLEMIHPDDRPIAEAAAELLQQGHPFDVEYRIVRPDGHMRWIRDRGRIIKNDLGEPLRIDGLAADITEKRTAEQALKEAQERFEDIFESSKDAIGYVSLDGTFVLANEAFSRLTGYSKQELLIKTNRDLTPPEDRELQATVIADVLETGMPKEYETEYVRKEGSRVPVSLTVFAVRGDNGKPAGVATIVKDVTERKRAEHLLRQSEERYRRLIAVSPYAILVNRGDRIIFANDQAIKLFGAVKAKEILEKSPMDLFHADDHDIVRERIHELFEGRAQMPMLEEKIETLDGRAVDVEVSGARFVDEEGPAILIMLRDVSERKRLQEQLRRTERVAELGTLASGMAHEIGTPMNVILGRAEYLMDRVTEEPIKRGLQTIITQVERITRVMNQLLSFARRKAPQRVPLDLRKVIDDGVEMFQERLERNQIRVEMGMADRCPMVLADADQMSQVLLNLIMNALHAMPDGGILRVGLEPEQPMVKLTIADTGHGIPPEIIRKIYDPFFTTKEFGKGTGLGLTVVKGIIEEHQGSISVESEENKGTRFTILLPRSEELMAYSTRRK